jgi:hypothetical protein
VPCCWGIGAPGLAGGHWLKGLPYASTYLGAIGMLCVACCMLSLKPWKLYRGEIWGPCWLRSWNWGPTGLSKGIGGTTSIGSPCDLMDSAADNVDPCDMLENLSEPTDMVRVSEVPDVVDICKKPEELEIEGMRGGRIALGMECAMAGCCTGSMCWSSSGMGSGSTNMGWSVSLIERATSEDSLCRLDGKRDRAFLKRPAMDG